jgi:CDP-glucose 4,6-dehydratase
MSLGFGTDNKILITGAGGFVGSWLAENLVAGGAAVVCMLRDKPRLSALAALGIADRVDIIWGDVTDFGVVERVINEYGVRLCYHLAAQPIVGVAHRSPLATFDTNIRGTWNLLEACRRSGHVEAVVVASSDKAYGDHYRLPYTEEFTLNGLYPYDASKACADALARCYHHTYGLPVVVSRMANIYGGGDFNFSRLIPGTIRSVLAGKDPSMRSDGTPERDYIFIEDAVRGYVSLAEKITSDASIAGQAFNFGTGAAIRAADLVESIIRLSGAAGLRPRPAPSARLQGEIDRQSLDASKAARILGWRPAVGLEEGLARTIAWYRTYFGSAGKGIHEDSACLLGLR